MQTLFHTQKLKLLFGKLIEKPGENEQEMHLGDWCYLHGKVIYTLTAPGIFFHQKLGVHEE